MAKLLWGVTLFVGGIVLTAAMGDVLWYGAIVAGLLMAVSGSRQLYRERATKAQLEQIVSKREDLLRRLIEEEPIDRIAEEYERSDEIPPIRTIQVAGHLIREMRDSDDEVSRSLAAHMASDQIVDSNMDPETAIDHFSFHDEVYFVDDQVLLCRKMSAFGRTPGTLILNKGFLFFFERSFCNRLFSRVGHAVSNNVPLLGIAAAGHDLVSGLSNSLKRYFDGSRKARLKARFRRPRSRALPLVDVAEVELMYKRRIIGTRPFVAIRGTSQGEPWQYLFTCSEAQDGDWSSSWMERLEVACIAEGNLLG